MARAGDVYIKRRSERQSDFWESPQERITRHDSSGFPRRRPGRVLGGQDTTLHAPRKPSRSSFMKRSPPRSPGCEYGMRPSLTAHLYKVLGWHFKYAAPSACGAGAWLPSKRDWSASTFPSSSCEYIRQIHARAVRVRHQALVRTQFATFSSLD